jgi:hypothetical protein
MADNGLRPDPLFVSRMRLKNAMSMRPEDNTPSDPDDTVAKSGDEGIELQVRRMHRRDINRVWEFLKLVFRGVNRETVEFQRPRHKQQFAETYENEGVEQLLFEIKGERKAALVGYVPRPCACWLKQATSIPGPSCALPPHRSCWNRR